MPKKKVPEKSAGKSTDKKISTKTLEHYRDILSAMQPDIWYKTADFENAVSVGRRRIKVLLSEMVELGFIESAGLTKGKKYKMKDGETVLNLLDCIVSQSAEL